MEKLIVIGIALVILLLSYPAPDKPVKITKAYAPEWSRSTR